MARSTTRTVTITETVYAGRTTIRRDSEGGQGTIEFVNMNHVKDSEGNDLGKNETGLLRAEFSELAGLSFPVKMANGSTVQVTGKTILDALESVHEYLLDRPDGTVYIP